MKRERTMFCGKEGGIYRNFYSSFKVVSFCGFDKKDIVCVRLEEDPKGDYWGWWDNGTGFLSKSPGFSHVYHKRFLVEMCSPDAFKRAIERGEGEILRIRVEEKL